jgi:hypothetical protein
MALLPVEEAWAGSAVVDCRCPVDRARLGHEVDPPFVSFGHRSCWGRLTLDPTVAQLPARYAVEFSQISQLGELMRPFIA